MVGSDVPPMKEWMPDIEACLRDRPLRYGMLVDAYCKRTKVGTRTAKARVSALEKASKLGKVPRIGMFRRGKREVWFGIPGEEGFRQLIAVDRAVQLDEGESRGEVTLKLWGPAKFDRAMLTDCSLCGARHSVLPVRIGPLVFKICSKKRDLWWSGVPDGMLKKGATILDVYAIAYPEGIRLKLREFLRAGLLWGVPLKPRKIRDLTRFLRSGPS